ncbi:hypothetical protein BKA64DRAFT_660245 [Cadophora sp. MPI-SDFR-AT-0126]|nr:hypothetical protein BKA64DRAFT_660245 [Leotiomycetes sp. MPI-SDFR-AT-0126]
MTFAWASENWNHDREERQRAKSEKASTLSDSADISLKEWLDSRAQYVTSIPNYFGALTRNQQQRAMWKAAEEEEDVGNTVHEPVELRNWLLSRRLNAGAAHKSAIDLTAAFSRPTIVPDLPMPPSTPRAKSAANNRISTNTSPYEATNPSLSVTTKKHEAISPGPIRLTDGQLFLALSRLVLEVNWDWFHANRLNFDMSDISLARCQQWWNNICQVYDEYCEAASQGVEALMKLYQQSKSEDHVLNIEQTVLNPIMRFLIGYKAGKSGDERGKAALEALLLEGDFLVYVREWCHENGMEYPGGTGRTHLRLKEYASESLQKSEGGY